ncbi:MAG: hypothetical protein KBD06_01955 [Candidatus Pacebacteria bacterium]|nr:hypothetical protein [Candidatus Paceibacterota bacterium]
MHISDLPNEYHLLARSSDQHQLAAALQGALGTETGFEFYEPILGTKRSGRLFSVLPHPKGDPITLELTPRVIAHQLLQLIKQNDVRFDASEQYPGFRQGWEINKLSIEGRPAAVVWATWTCG